MESPATMGIAASAFQGQAAVVLVPSFWDLQFLDSLPFKSS